MSQNHHQTNRIQDHFTDEAVAYAEQGYEAVQEVIQKEPMAITLAAFGIGLAVGTAAAVMLARQSPPSRTQQLESFGKKILDSISEALPESVRQHLPR